jgi:hypothetical protein
MEMIVFWILMIGFLTALVSMHMQRGSRAMPLQYAGTYAWPPSPTRPAAVMPAY